ncbi:MAG: prepilin peptidase [Phycisphaerae bacterium]|nr:prepilin peptidase [Phycisphaerae bacterium]
MSRLGDNVWAYGVLAVVLVVAAVTDVRRGKIYNWTTYPAIVIGLVGHLCMGGLTGTAGESDRPGAMGLLGALAGLAAGFGPLLLAWLAGGIGGGDAKIMAAVGSLTGWRFALTAIFYGFAVAAIMAIFILLRRRIVRETLSRVGWFLWLLLVRAKPGDPATEKSPRLPFGLALCIGSFIALVLICIFGPSERMFILGI